MTELLPTDNEARRVLREVAIYAIKANMILRDYLDRADEIQRKQWAWLNSQINTMCNEFSIDSTKDVWEVPEFWNEYKQDPYTVEYCKKNDCTPDYTHAGWLADYADWFKVNNKGIAAQHAA